MIAFLRLLTLIGSVGITACGFIMLSINPFPLMLPFMIIISGIFIFSMIVFRVGEVD